MIDRKTYNAEDLKVVNVGAFAGSDAFLVYDDNSAFLVDSGFSFCANIMIDKIKKELKGRSLDYCLLTHSHYDHASGSAYLKDFFPELKIVSGEYASKIFDRPSALKVMREMNEAVAPEYGITEFEDKLSLLHSDIILHDGESIDFGGRKITAIEAPGHTRCSVSYYLPQEDFLISCETQGVYAGEELVSPCCLVGYSMTMDYIERAIGMNPAYVLIPHYKVLNNEEGLRFFRNAALSNRGLMELVLTLHNEGKDYDEIFSKYYEKYCSPKLMEIQPVKALKLNASYMIPMLIRECAEQNN